MARKIAAERDTARQQLERITAMGRELVAEVKLLRAQREVAIKRFEEIGALSHLQLEFRKQELEAEIAEQTDRLEREKLKRLLPSKQQDSRSGKLTKQSS